MPIFNNPEDQQNFTKKETGEIYNEQLQREIEPKRGQMPKKRRKLKIAAFFVVFILISGFLFSRVVSTDQSISYWLNKIPIIKHFSFLVEGADKKIKGETDGRINILLLGMGGKKHEGGYLTDTIMLISIQPATKKIALISIPRDLAVPIENMGWQKINSINAYAESEQEGSGGVAISQALSDVLNIPIDYYVRADFEGFSNIVDELGGVDINVENTLDDYSYPVAGREDAADYQSRYEHLRIEKGWQHMDGDLALKYARSRHGINGEGSDFARAKRQQKILEAIKDKVLSAKTLLNPAKLSGLANEFNEHINTNLKTWEALKIWDISKDVDKNSIINKVIDNSPNGLLYDNRTAEGAYILSPRSGDFTEIQYFVNNIFSEGSPREKTEIVDDGAAIEVRNGTWINGLASQKAMDLEKYGFKVVRIGNSSKKDFSKSVIYDLTYGDKNKSLEILKQKTNANVSLGMPDWLAEDIKKSIANEENPIQPDFILIIGQSVDLNSSETQNAEE